MALPPIRRIGFIGLGVMGRPMARHLLKAGFALTVKSRSPAPVEELVAHGAVAAKTPCEVGANSDLVITMLPNSPDVADVCCGPDGIIDALSDSEAPTRRAALIVADMSTISPKISIEIGKKLQKAGVQFIEAPVSGGDTGAMNATLSIMCGGPEKVFERVRPVFEALGKSIVRIGDWGAGQTTKLANNIICANTIEAVGEALVLTAKAGIDPDKMFQAIRGGAAACWSLDAKVPKIVARDFKPGFMVKLHLKDLDLALETFAALDPQAARIVELRFFAGLTVPEVAAILGIGTATVVRDWNYARSWLYRRLS